MSPSDEARADRVENALTDLGKQVRATPSKAEVQEVKNKARWQAASAVIISFLIALTSLGWSGVNSSDIADNTARAAATEQSVKSLQDANEKLAARGLPQIPVPEPGQQIDINGLVNSVSALVLADIAGDPRFKGSEGDAGSPGEEGRIGHTGEGGQPGSDGARGQDGDTPVPSLSDSGDLVFSTPFSSVNVGNVVGPKGEKGDKGDQGDLGPAGPTCPDGFTPQKFWVDTYDDETPLGDPTPTRTLTILCV